MNKNPENLNDLSKGTQDSMHTNIQMLHLLDWYCFQHPMYP